MMITYEDWAAKHPQAAADLRLVVANAELIANSPPGSDEAYVQVQVRLEASEHGARLFRNNVGAGTLENGSHVRWGLANDSARINKVLKSADLIGIKPVLIEPRHVGGVIGQFVSREIKRPKWKYTGTEREIAQMNWANLVISLGGDAAIVTGRGSF